MSSDPEAANPPSETDLEPADRTLVAGVLDREPRALAKTITLIESARDDHRRRAAKVLHALAPHAGASIRLGISGSPGAGKSTFIEALGLELLRRGRRVAVLAVDPSSPVSGGSILGDETRMERLSASADAFVRPSPSRGAAGGVADRTREAVTVCEAAGFDVVLVETVGSGQGETAVAGMVDLLVLIELPNAGDELQAIKRGIVEAADAVVVNKADLDPAAAERARRRFAGKPVAVVASAIKHQGIGEFWDELERLHRALGDSGGLAEKRRRQAVAWMWALIDLGLRDRFREHPAVRRELGPTTRAVAEGRESAAAAAIRLLDYVAADAD